MGTNRINRLGTAIRRLLLLCLMLTLSFGARSQSFEVQQLLLNAEKLTQLKSILRDMKNGYQTLTTGYRLVKNISQGNFSLHETFLNGLMLVSPAVRKYHRIADIIKLQSQLNKEYKNALLRFRQGGSFSTPEIAYLERVYGQLVSLTLRNLEELTMVVTSGKLRMSDDERLRAIDKIFLEMEDRITFLRDFNERTNLLALQRKREITELKRVQNWHLQKP
ncbi:TerB family tellurite resistance protein [Nubsella zeaxanthinifaciens]|uniref:TerB family tellurite resistance protein n=1 Tax=Nubsella zeaxanthinifaciens TaxID=392412 RepID=UPI003CFC85EF